MSDNETFVGEEALYHTRHVDSYQATFGSVKLEKLTYAEVEDYFGDIGRVEDLEPESVTKLLRDKVLEPDLSELGEEKLGEMKPMIPAELIVGIMEVSDVLGDVEMQQDGTATVELDEGNFQQTN